MSGDVSKAGWPFKVATRDDSIELDIDSERQQADPKYAVGSILRYAAGSTALMRVTSISRDHGGRGVHRYYGDHHFGGAHGAYEYDCSLATADDLATWATEHPAADTVNSAPAPTGGA
jgi:hypothetical protein